MQNREEFIMSVRSTVLITVCAVVVQSAQASVVSSWRAPSVDDGNPISNFVASWRTDVTTGEHEDLPSLFGRRALAADNSSGRLYTSGDSITSGFSVLATYVVDPTSVTDGLAQLGPSVQIRDAGNNPIGTVSSMGFANGVIYAFAASGLYAINPQTALATLLPSPIPGQVFPGMDYHTDDGLMYAVTPKVGQAQSIVSFDLDTFTVTLVAQVPASAYGGLGFTFDGLAAGEGKVYLTGNYTGVTPIVVFDLESGTFEESIPGPPRVSENSFYPSGATFFTALNDFVAAGPSVIERGIQVRSADFGCGVLEIFNFNDVDVDLSGWTLLTEDFNQFQQKSAANGLDGVVIEAQTSIFVHYNDDAPAGDPDRLNRSEIGGNFALPFEPKVYVVQLLAPKPSESLPYALADHIQWKIVGQGKGVAGTKTSQAVSADLWTASLDFIGTTSATTRIDLVDLTGNDFGDPDEYLVQDASACPADLNGDGVIDGGDLGTLLADWDAISSNADINCDGTVDGGDLAQLLAAWGDC